MAAKAYIDVYVKLPSGKNCQYDLSPSATIQTLCERIAKEQEVSENQVRMKYQGKILNKTHSLSYLGVRAETILKAEIIVPKLLTIIVQFPAGRKDEYSMKNIDSLSSLQDKIAVAESVPSYRVILKSEGRQLRGVSLMDVGIADRSVVKVEIRDEIEPPASKPTGATSEPVTEQLDQQQLTDILSSFDNCGRRVEVVFSFDTTGSMYSCLDQVRQKLRECCTRLIQDIPSIRIGLIAHGDYCDQYSYVLRSIDLTADVQRLVDFANNVPATGGGDAPECYEWALRKAQQLDWSEDSAKALVVIGDCEPHPPSYTDQRINWHEELELLTGMGVKVYGVRAQNETRSKPFYEELAERSGGCYLELRHFDVITDMFLAVCYRESNEEQLGAFEREIEEKGEMTEERREMFKQLEEKPVEAQPRKSKREIRDTWWDVECDNGKPQYSYLAETDKWIRYTGNAESTSPSFRTTSSKSSSPAAVPCVTPHHVVRKATKKQGCKRGCSLM